MFCLGPGPARPGPGPGPGPAPPRAGRGGHIRVGAAGGGWLIAYAQVARGPGAGDVAELVVHVLVDCLPVDALDEYPFWNFCCVLAAAPADATLDRLRLDAEALEKPAPKPAAARPKGRHPSKGGSRRRCRRTTAAPRRPARERETQPPLGGEARARTHLDRVDVVRDDHELSLLLFNQGSNAVY